MYGKGLLKNSMFFNSPSKHVGRDSVIFKAILIVFVGFFCFLPPATSLLCFVYGK